MKVVATISANLAPTALDFLVLSTLIVEVGKPVVSENANTRMKIATIQPWLSRVQYLDLFFLFS